MRTRKRKGLWGCIVALSLCVGAIGMGGCSVDVHDHHHGHHHSHHPHR